MNTNKELRELRDKLLESIRLYLSVLVITEDTTAFKEFASYVDRFMASEVLFTLKKHGYEEEITRMMDEIGGKS